VLYREVFKLLSADQRKNVKNMMWSSDIVVKIIIIVSITDC